MTLTAQQAGAALVAPVTFSTVKGSTMQIKITRSTVCDGQPVDVGQIVDASENDARVLLRMNKAIAAQDAPGDAQAAPGTNAPGDDENAQGEAVPRRRGRPAKASA